MAANRPADVKTVCCDLDGVIHSYTSGWRGPRNLPDPPVDGALDWIRKILDHPKLELAIFSSRSKHFGGRRAIKKWLYKHGLKRLEIDMISFPKNKPPAHIYIDDRGYYFNGIFPHPTTILNFRTWQQKR